MTQEVTLREPPELPVYPIYTGHSWGLNDFIIQQFEDDDITPVNYVGTYTLAVFRDNTRRDRVLTKQLAPVGNELEIGQTKTENKFTPGKYFFDIYNDISSTLSEPFVRGSLQVYQSR